MGICKMCGGNIEEGIMVCPICGSKQTTSLKLSATDASETVQEEKPFVASYEILEEEKMISFATEPYVEKPEVKKTEREYYDSVDMRKYKNKVQVGYIMIYAIVAFSILSSFMMGENALTTISIFLSILIYVVPTLVVQFTRSRIAVVILAIICVLSGKWLMMVGAGFCVYGIFEFKDKWSFYQSK